MLISKGLPSKLKWWLSAILTYPPSKILIRVGSACLEEPSFSPCSSLLLSRDIWLFIFFPYLLTSVCMCSGFTWEKQTRNQ